LVTERKQLVARFQAPLGIGTGARWLAQLPEHPRAAVVALTLVAAALRLFRLGSQSLWHDEAVTAGLAAASLPGLMAEILTREGNMALYYLLINLWTTLGNSEWMLRFPSALLSAATVPLLYALAARLFGTSTALFATALFAVHPNALAYAQEARSYSLFVLLVVTSWFMLVRVMERPTIWNSAALVLATAASVYAHLFGLLSIAAQAVGVLALLRQPLPLRRLLFCASALGILIAPAVWYVVARDVGQLSWVPPLSIDKVMKVGTFVLGAAGGRYKHWSGIVTVVLTALPLMLSGGELIRRWPWREASARGYVLAWAGLLVPMTVAVVVSLVNPVLVMHYLLECVPFAVVLIAAGTLRVRPGSLAVGLGAALIGMSLFGDGYYFAHIGKKEDWRSAIRHILSEARPSDVVLGLPAGSLFSYTYYEGRYETERGAPELVYPDRELLAQNLALRSSEERRRLNERTFAAAMKRVRERYRRVWLLLQEPWRAHVMRVLREVGPNYRPLKIIAFERVSVVLLENPAYREGRDAAKKQSPRPPNSR